MTTISLESRLLESDFPTPEELQKEIPLTNEHAAFVLRSRESIEAILNGWDTRLLLIAGPCSIHDLDSALEYGRRFKILSEKVSDQFFLVMRTYFEKSRTIIGWKGMLYDPDMNGSYHLIKGIHYVRQLLAVLTDMHVPTASELLEINTVQYYADFLSWGCIGARTCSSPPHRQLAAALNFPIGFKNSIDGNIDHSIHAVQSAAVPQMFLGLAPSGRMARILAEGNPLCHIILRGGLCGPNYYPEAIHAALKKCRLANVRERLIVDCSHDNCGKRQQQQVHVFESLIQQMLDGNRSISGMMLESHLESGSQEISFPLKYGVSITDPCLDWQTTEQLVLQAYDKLRRQ